MCGIAGIIFADPNRPVETGRLEAMSRAIIHRGPDGEGMFRAAGVGLAHRRLSIIDLAGGTQPIGNEDGSIHLHARAIKFEHPVSNNPIFITCAPPDETLWNYFYKLISENEAI